MTALFAAIRVAHFLSLMAAFGAAAFMVLLGRRQMPEPPERWTRAFFPAAAAIAFITAILWLVLAAARMTGDPAQLNWAAIKLVASATGFGRIAMWRILGLGLLLVFCCTPARGRIGVVAGLSALLLASLGLTSHAAAEAGAFPLIRAANDAAHLLTAGFWIGGLAVLAILIRRHHARPEYLAAPFHVFSRWGTPAVAVLVLSGIANAATILPVRAISTANAYADILAAKIALALLMIALAVVNRRELVPALGTGNPNIVRKLSRSICAEILLGMLVIGIVGYLGQMAPG
jgi:putative copper resistance protein D